MKRDNKSYKAGRSLVSCKPETNFHGGHQKKLAGENPSARHHTLRKGNRTDDTLLWFPLVEAEIHPANVDSVHGEERAGPRCADHNKHQRHKYEHGREVLQEDGREIEWQRVRQSPVKNV